MIMIASFGSETLKRLFLLFDTLGRIRCRFDHVRNHNVEYFRWLARTNFYYEDTQWLAVFFYIIKLRRVTVAIL